MTPTPSQEPVARERERDLEDVLIRNGFVRCDIPACNCGSWHARYGLPERMAELKELLSDAGHPLCNDNGNLISNALAQLIAERDALSAPPAQVQGEAVAYAIFAPNKNIRIWSEASDNLRALLKANGETLVPLYAAPPTAQAAPVAASEPSEAKIYNPWREFIENVMTGDNYFRSTEYHELIAELDRLYAIEAAVPAAVLSAGASEEVPIEVLAMRVMREGHFPVLASTVPFGEELAPFLRALAAALSVEPTKESK
jgi:hypothetical protein